MGAAAGAHEGALGGHRESLEEVSFRIQSRQVFSAFGARVLGPGGLAQGFPHSLGEGFGAGPCQVRRPQLLQGLFQGSGAGSSHDRECFRGEGQHGLGAHHHHSRRDCQQLPVQGLGIGKRVLDHLPRGAVFVADCGAEDMLQVDLIGV